MNELETASRFFMVQLPLLVLRSFDDFAHRNGVLVFEVEQAGTWSFCFGSDEPVRPGEAHDAGLRLRFTPDAFQDFIAGSLEVTQAVATGRVSAQGGAFELLEGFARLLNPPSGDLGWSTD